MSPLAVGRLATAVQVGLGRAGFMRCTRFEGTSVRGEVIHVFPPIAYICPSRRAPPMKPRAVGKLALVSSCHLLPVAPMGSNTQVSGKTPPGPMEEKPPNM